MDAHATVGFSGIYNKKDDQMQLDKSSPIQPELRAIDGYNPKEQLIAYLNSKGVTTVHTGHGPGAAISGQTCVAKTHGETVDQVILDDATMMAMTIGPSVRRNFKSPGTTAKEIAMLRTELIKAQEYQGKMLNTDVTKHPSRNLKMEALVELLEGKMKALITVMLVCIALAISAFYELVEWWAALFSAEAAESFLGTQGYVWDTQSDMLWALCGAILSLVFLSRLHDRQIRALP